MLININGTPGNDVLKPVSIALTNVFGGGGFDIVDYSTLASTSGVVLDLSRQNTNFQGSFQGGAAGNHRLFNIEGAVGTSFADTFTGGTGNNSFSGGAGDDVFVASLGHDTIEGGAGFDTLDLSQLAVSVDFNTFGSPQVTAPDNPAFSIVTAGIERVIGTSSGDNLEGSVLGSGGVVDGGAGGDQIYGIGGQTLIGGSGADRFFASNFSGLGVVTVADFQIGVDQWASRLLTDANFTNATIDGHAGLFATSDIGEQAFFFRGLTTADTVALLFG